MKRLGDSVVAVLDVARLMTVSLRIDREYLGYLAARAVLEEIVADRERHPFGSTDHDPADLAQKALDYIARLESEGAA